MLVRLFDPEKRDSEISLTIDVSSHGARVVSKKFWQPNLDIVVHSMGGSMYSRARVVHCQSFKDRSYTVGLELTDPTSDWIESNGQPLETPKRQTSKLVFDVGMHMGEDTEFYLGRGYRVVGVEANPKFLPLLQQKFCSQLKSGELHIVNKAISNAPGRVQFAINSQRTTWSSLSPKFIEREVNLGHKLDLIEVETVLFEDLLHEYGTPYYLKIDIEGMDMTCIEALHRVAQRPQYVSFESAVTSPMAQVENGFSELAHLWVLGYHHFKYVDQASLGKLEGALLQAEGPPLRYTHRWDSSGPFGEESPGEWVGIDAASRQMRRLIRYQNTLGLGGRHHRRLLSKVGRRLRRYVKRLPSHSWYDLHARLSLSNI